MDSFFRALSKYLYFGQRWLRHPSPVENLSRMPTERLKIGIVFERKGLPVSINDPNKE